MQEETVVTVPDAYRVVPRAADEVVAIRLHELDTADLVLMALQGPLAAVLLLFVSLPQFDGHVPCTTCQVVT